jgi:poly[(R)-3-hydroxyalkanoate] polymerase subunit PhaC
MTNKSDDASTFPDFDPFKFQSNLQDIAERSQRLVQDFYEKERDHSGPVDPAAMSDPGIIDPNNISKAFQSLFTAMMSDPQRFAEAQANLWQTHMNLWQTTAKRLMGEDVEPVVQAGPRDKRFKDAEWNENVVFDYIKQSYLLTSNWINQAVDETEDLEPEERRKVEFYTQQYVDALSPSNFVMTNPEVLRETLTSNGENLVKGLSNLLEDLERGHGKLNIKQTDMDYFKVGENMALTPGKVVFQNDIIQLLQYTPTTEKVFKTPLLIFPPWINKYYILDLRPENSFIKYFVEKGYTVFVVSWVNPGKALREKTFENYMFEGVFAALDAVEDATGEKQVNAIGYCIGGTLLSASLAYMADKKKERVKSATFFAAQADFSEAGELLVFIDDEQLKTIEKEIDASGGYLEGTSMANTFNMLRSNDLIWSYVVNNYLMGRDPRRFDLLFWNADATRMPKNLHLFYLRKCYLENALSKGEMEMGGVKLDLGKVKTPVYLQSSKDDHIAPYRSIYNSTKLFGGEINFMIAGSGHIAGVINHPDAGKYMYWTNPDLPDTVDEWWENAEEHKGSWWPEWELWLRDKSGDMVDPRTPGDGKLDILEDAPGSFVMVRS